MKNHTDNTTPKKKSISKFFTKLFVFSFIAFAILVAVAFSWFFQIQRKTIEEYLDSSLSLSSKNLSNYFDTIERVGYGITSNWSIINLFSTNNYIVKSTALENSFQMISLLVSLNPSITDFMVVTADGNVQSFFAGLDYNIINEIPAHDLFRNPYDLTRDFYFFPEDSYWSENYFVYCMPIFDMDISLKTTQKIATGVILCNKNQIQQSLKSSSAVSGESYALCHNGDIVFTGSSDFANLFDDTNAITGSMTLPREDFSVFGAHKLQYTNGQTWPVFIFACSAFIIVISVLSLHIYNVRNCITKPILTTKQQLSEFSSSDLTDRIALTNIMEIDYIIEDINNMILAIRSSTKEIILTQNSLYETELRTKEAELYALQSQINPHFLYNTLQCICGLAAMGRTKDISDVTYAMSDVFKYSITPGRFVDCADEINIIYKYLSIYKIRYSGNLDYEITVDEKILDCKMLKMIIQPTVENAMLHAYVATEIKPKIYISGEISDGNICFRIIDNGTGIPRDKLIKLQANLERSFSESIEDNSSFGLGLYNINRRIKLVYGEDYGISIFSNPNGTEICITIPWVEQE